MKKHKLLLVLLAGAVMVLSACDTELGHRHDEHDCDDGHDHEWCDEEHDDHDEHDHEHDDEEEHDEE